MVNSVLQGEERGGRVRRLTVFDNGTLLVPAVGTKNSSNTVVGLVTTIKQRALKGQTVLLPCPSQGSPPPRLAWLLPGNGVLPAPYYGSRLTVHRNGSLELRGVRVSDSGTLVCVVRSERGETRIQENAGVIAAPSSGASLGPAQSLSSRPWCHLRKLCLTVCLSA
uniref:Ig-like domain-containing protein n=1 Tax=Sparus aurata TaxID=8175 RepID=A0A671Z450_SPAAU